MDTTTKPGDVEEIKDFGKGPEASVTRWLAEIKAYEKAFEGWDSAAGKIVKRYRLENEASLQSSVSVSKRMNLLWSNIQIMGPAIYSRQPEPDVSRTNKDRDLVARAASIILQRALETEVQRSEMHEENLSALNDWLLTGRGQMFVRYEPTYGEEVKDLTYLQPVWLGDQLGNEAPDYFEDDEGSQVLTATQDEEGRYFTEGEGYEPVVDECVKWDHIHWKDFGHTPAPKWNKVRAVWKRELLTRDQLVKRFKEKGKECTLTKTTTNALSEDELTSFGDVFKRAEVFEIWDKETEKVIWVSPGYIKGPLDVQDDPLKLEGFFPCPKPLYGTVTTDSLIPVAEFQQYKTQADEIDLLTQRISLLTKAMKVAGVYNGEFKEIERLIEGDENVMIGIDTWAAFAEAGGTEGAISFMPIKDIANVLVNLVNTREQLKQDLYEITGISDILRGQSDPRETLGAQELKGKFGGIRLSAKQAEMARFIRDLIQLGGEIMADLFDSERLLLASSWLDTAEAQILDRRAQQGQGPDAATVFQQAVEMLKDDRMRGFKVDISTDQIVIQDDERNKQQKLEFITHVSGYLQNAIPAAEQFPAIGPLLGEILMFGVRSFKKGRALEASFEEAIEMMNSVQKPPEEEKEAEKQGPSQGEEMLNMAKAEGEQAKAQSTLMRAQIEQGKVEAATMRAEQELALKKQAQELDILKAQMENASHIRMSEIEELKTQLSQMQMLISMDKNEKDYDSKIQQIRATSERTTSEASD